MLYANFAAYTKESTPEGFKGSICENNFFGVLSTHDGLSKERGDEVLRKLASDIAEQKIEHLADLDAYISEFCKSANLPARFSLSCGYFTGEVFFLKTIGDGAVYLKRNKAVNKLLEKDTSASGYVEEGDSYVFAVNQGDAETQKEFLERALTKSNPTEAVEELTSLLGAKEQQDGAALFVYFEKKEPELTTDEQQLVSDPTVSAMAAQNEPSRKNRLKELIENVRSQLQSQDQKKKKTLIIVTVVLLVFIWSVVLGYQRRANAEIDKKTQETKQLVQEKLRQADDVAFLNLARATALISEAKDDVQTLKKELKGKNQGEVDTLEKLVADKEEKILKKENRGADEYFDLSVEDRKATGSKIYLDGDTAVVLDQQAGVAYLLSFTKKSLDKRSASEIRAGNLVSRSQDNVLVYKKGEGVKRVGSDNKAQKAIENDADWGNITGMVTYNNNLYLLDGQKGDVYKYVPAEKGFSEKSSYFKGQDKPDLTGATSLAIDLSVYVSFPQSITKFTGGVKEGFNPTFPESGVNIVKILTNKDIEKLYAWDKKKSVLYVINKDGGYERQIKSSIFSSGDDVVVFGTNAYVLQGSKIYKVSVN